MTNCADQGTGTDEAEESDDTEEEEDWGGGGVGGREAQEQDTEGGGVDHNIGFSTPTKKKIFLTTSA
jgi:hypothetical protein